MNEKSKSLLAYGQQIRLRNNAHFINPLRCQPLHQTLCFYHKKIFISMKSVNSFISYHINPIPH